jgi:hypothetical protein
LAAADSDTAIDVYAADLSGLAPPEELPDPPADPPTDPPADPPASGGAPTGGGQAAPAGGASTAGESGPAAPALVAAFGKRLKASASGTVALRVRCAGQASCRGRLLVESRARVLGRKSFSLAAGRTATVRVKLSRKGRGALARGRRLRATVVVQTLDGAGALTSSSLRAVSIKAAPKKRR